MRFLGLLGILLAAMPVSAETAASQLWDELKAKREGLVSLHQEFDVSQTFQRRGASQSMQRQLVLDMAQGQWREGSISGSGNHVKIFDGKDLFRMEEGGNEFVRTKRKAKDDAPVPLPYSLMDVEWSKMIEVERRPCGVSGSNHQCVILEAPLKRWRRTNTATNFTSLLEGTGRVLLDTETVLMLSLSLVQVIQTSGSSYQSNINYALKRMNYGKPANAGLFALPAEVTSEVKELSKWNSAKLKKQFAGKAAPEFTLTDLQGKQITLADLKGKTVLLDFWTTWCPPCRADGPALDKLHSKYGGKELVIVGVSVSEERPQVEKFLKDHPHNFPIVLTTENEMPRPLQIGLFPTYIVIDSKGVLTSAVEGDQGFGELRKLLKKAGLEVD